MKHLLLFSLVLLLTTACSQKVEEDAQLNMEKNKQETTKTDNNQDTSKKTEATNNTQVAKTKANIKSEQIIQATLPVKADPSKFEDLTKKYSGVIIKTNFGDIKIKLYNENSPKTVNNFLNLAKINFYNQTKFHRVIKDFMIQGGDPNSRDDDWSNDGTGGPGYKFQDEINEYKLVKGSLAMANSGINTNGSQFFIVTAESTPWLDGKHTNFGEVIEGMDIVSQIEGVEKNNRDHPIKDVIIESIELLK